MNGAHTTPLRIGARGFSVREQLLLRSLVRIAGTPLPRPWEFVEAAPYDALFTPPGAGDGIGDDARDGAARGDDAGPDTQRVARIPVQGPLESERLALLLDTLKQELPRLGEGIPAAGALASAPVPALSGPSRLSGLSGAAVAAGQAEPLDDGAAVMRRLLNRDETPFAWLVADDLDGGDLGGGDYVIVVHPAARTWSAPGLTASAPAASAVRDLAARLVQGGLRRVDVTPDDLSAGQASSHRLELLLWHVGLLVSPEGVLPEVRRTRRLRLARWPDFGSFGSDALQLKLSAFLVSRSYSIDELLLAAGGAGERVVAFLNACALCGLFVSDAADARPDPRESSAPRQFGDVMRMVRSALGMAQG
jgi:hypothetical protein